MMLLFRLLLFVLLTMQTTMFSTDDSWIRPQSSSFHHALHLAHTRLTNAPVYNQSWLFSLSSLLPMEMNESPCRRDLLLVISGLAKREMWALKMIDAWGIKPPAGVLQGSILWLGSYDECVNSLYLLQNKTHVAQPFSTRYCTLTRNSSEDDQVMLRKPSFLVGLCLPLSCQSSDFNIHGLSVHCDAKHRRLSVGALMTLILIALLIGFVLSACFIPHLKDFSPLITMSKIFSLKQSDSTYPFLHGVRALSLLWIIVGHSYAFQLSLCDNLVSVFDNIHNSTLTQLIFGAIFAVDSFFVISGFLAAIVFTTTIKKEGTLRLRHILTYYIHRYIRLTPTLVFILLVSINLTPYLGQGPLFPTSTGFEVPACRSYTWWRSLFYINNLFSVSSSCLPVTWYLANDTQFHLLAPLLLVPFVLGRRRLTYFLLCMLILTSIISTAAIIGTHPGMEQGMNAVENSLQDFFEQAYITPWCRIGAFAIGMITGLLVVSNNSTLSSSNIFLFTIISILLPLICIFFSLLFGYLPAFWLTAYQSLSHQGWSLAVGWLLFVCGTNQGGLVNKILSSPIWSPMSRLGYTAYLVHAMIILYNVYSRSSTIHYQTHVLLDTFISHCVLTFVAASIVVILVESPCTILEKKIRNRPKVHEPLLTANEPEHISNYGTTG